MRGTRLALTHCLPLHHASFPHSNSFPNPAVSSLHIKTELQAKTATHPGFAPKPIPKGKHTQPFHKKHTEPAVKQNAGKASFPLSYKKAVTNGHALPPPY